MAIYIYTDEFIREPWENTVAYYPFKEDYNDKVWSRTLSTSWCSISWGYLNIERDSSYIQLSQWISNSILTINVRHYYWANSSSVYWNWNALFANSAEQEHACFPANTSRGFQVGKVWFFNDSFVQWDTIISLANRYNIIIVKDWTNETIYINWENVLDATSFDNANYPVNFIWSCATNKPEAAQWKMSELIFESKKWTAQEVADYFNQTKSNYGIQ